MKTGLVLNMPVECVILPPHSLVTRGHPGKNYSYVGAFGLTCLGFLVGGMGGGGEGGGWLQARFCIYTWRRLRTKLKGMVYNHVD